MNGSIKELKGTIYGPDFQFHPGRLVMENGLIREVMLADETVRTIFHEGGSGTSEAQMHAPYIIPGLIDIHFHGCMDKDVCDGTLEAIHTIARYEASRGITAICPATLTLPAEELKQILSQAADFARWQKQSGGGEPLSELIGINMEGPFISHEKKGAQNGKYIIPCDADLCRDFLRVSGGLVKIIGLAPEANPDFEEYIAAVKDKVRISLAHTNADYDTAMRAIRAGASHAVHLFNAMPEMTHRAPGTVGAAADSEGVTAELICDGNHVHPCVVRSAFRMFGDERIVLISDSLRAAGMGDGEIMLGGQKVVISGTRATLKEGGNLAGSVSDLMGCLEHVVNEMHIPAEQAVRCATWNPAKVIGALESYGSLQPGKKADVLLLDGALRLCQVYRRGQPLYG